MLKSLEYYMSLNYKVEVSAISEEDGGGWLATHPELEGCMSDGETREEAIQNLDDARREWIDFCLRKDLAIPEPKQEEEIEYSGKFTLRVPKSIHKKLVEKSEEENVSLNNLVNQYITEGLSGGIIQSLFNNSIKKLQKERVNVNIHIPHKNVETSSNDDWPGIPSGLHQLKQFGTLNRIRNNTGNRLSETFFNLEVEGGNQYEQ
ncbi:type II toxin-antitoxin system HicB family antitoxin [Bacillus altitudinis]|uniref:type II toxin-antitoxin system HicB family antitoxin n=1 Tax=Bacillus altitudinis TaxID=293387 RepID=UPI002041747B|nr:type II toxin-antitoxin system HicB family antitoxin [Bacillus altitudinis]MCM3046644.1 type II toxin-antitoxin system HicB family antitoxin [Bacillus altitudinis]MEC1805180.1 toxin-antitoxin system HicB family antitoxin [Bacillus altitudinis]